MLKREIVRPPEHLFPPDEWRIVEAHWAPAYLPRAETVFALSNGYLGMRGTVEDGRPVYSPGTFVNGFHATWPIVHPEEAYGLARVGQSIVNVPDATVIELFVDDEPLFLPSAHVREYARVRSCRLVSLKALRENLDRFWDRADVVVEDRRSPVRVQQAIRWNVFQLAQATWRAEGSGIPAKGLTGGAYDGHSFWDTEAYVLPFLAYTQRRDGAEPVAVPPQHASEGP